MPTTDTPASSPEPGPASGPEPGKADAGAPRHSMLPRGKRSGLDARVRLLTRALDLDAKQQAALRQVLIDQRVQIQRIWSDEKSPAAERIAASRAVGARTADRIRGLLNEEQLKKYNPPPRPDAGHAVRDAHVEEWMNGGTKRQAP